MRRRQKPYSYHSSSYTSRPQGPSPLERWLLAPAIVLALAIAYLAGAKLDARELEDADLRAQLSPGSLAGARPGSQKAGTGAGYPAEFEAFSSPEWQEEPVFGSGAVSVSRKIRRFELRPPSAAAAQIAALQVELTFLDPKDFLDLELGADQNGSYVLRLSESKAQSLYWIRNGERVPLTDRPAAFRQSGGKFSVELLESGVALRLPDESLHFFEGEDFRGSSVAVITNCGSASVQHVDVKNSAESPDAVQITESAG